MKKKRLYISLEGILSKKEIERLYTDIRFCVNDLGPGFSVVTDLTNSQIGHLSGASVFQKISAFLVEKQVGEVVRVVGRSRVVYLQILKLSDKIQGYEPKYFSCLEEAEEYLDLQPAKSHTTA